MKSSTLWSIVGAVVAVIIAFWLVNAVLRVMWFAAKLGIVAVVAVIVYFAIRSLFKGSDKDRDKR